MFTLKERVIRTLFLFAGTVSILILAGICVLLVRNGLPAIRELGFSAFFSRNLWNPSAYGKPSYGLWPAIMGTVLTTSIAMALAIPLGIGTACFMSFLAPNNLREWLKPAFELLASIPSVVVGFLGLVLTGPLIARTFGISNGLNVLNGGVLLAIMSLPTIISVSEDALQSVSRDLWRGSLALGATRFRTIMRVMLPTARSGLIAAILLGMGRAVGETMTVLMAAGNSLTFPTSLLSSARTLTSTIAIELGEVPFGSQHYHSLFVVGAVLFVLTFFVNIIGELVAGVQKR